jgi:hypothetical protein
MHIRLMGLRWVRESLELNTKRPDVRVAAPAEEESGCWPAVQVRREMEQCSDE